MNKNNTSRNPVIYRLQLDLKAKNFVRKHNLSGFSENYVSAEDLAKELADKYYNASYKDKKKYYKLYELWRRIVSRTLKYDFYLNSPMCLFVLYELYRTNYTVM